MPSEPPGSAAKPTPEQLADWLTRCTDEERQAFCAKALDSAERARRCLLMDHDGLEAEAKRLRQERDEVYEQGWNDAAFVALQAAEGRPQ